MIEWEVGDDHLRVVDADSAELAVRGDEFDVVGPGSDISRPVDETVECTAARLRLPHAVVYAFALGDDERYELDPSGGPLSLPPAEYVVDVNTEIKTYLRFSGRAEIRSTDEFDSLVVDFPERRRAILGFRSRHEFPADTITVPETPEGIAAGISHLSSSIKTDGPDRSYPTLRGHPPLLECGDRLDVPASIREDAPDDGVELLVPPCLESLFVTAPLAYYLRADVGTERRPEPTLRLPGQGIEHDLSSLPALERDVERLLRKLFFLDCLVRNAGPYRTTLFEAGLLDALELDAASLYEASHPERLARYLEVPHAAVEHRLPEWHLSTYVDPTPAHAEVLPFLLDRLSLIYRPRTSELAGKELIERSLEDFYRGGSYGSDRVRADARQVATVDIVKPELRCGRAHGWLADGVPIDVFKSAPAAYRNRLDYLECDGGQSICVVLNDPEMEGEHEDVASIYRGRADDLAIDVTVEESLDTGALARVFETNHAFVHYIGHCETDGLRCPDGYLATSSLDRCRAETFFLNACGSFYEGRDLVANGSVAGAVTVRQVLNDHAIKVGSTFAKLLIHGFSIERAMSLARRRIMMGKDYAVVGDGTHTIVQNDCRLPVTATVERTDDETFLLSLDCYSTSEIGSYYVPHVEGNDHSYLSGTTSSFALDREELVGFLEETEAPVLYDGDVYWSGELWPRFEA